MREWAETGTLVLDWIRVGVGGSSPVFAGAALRRSLAICAVIVMTSIALEIAVRYFVKAERIRIQAPVAHSPGAEFFDGAHPVFGTWHVPNASFEHRSECFRATYTSNGVGARDREREHESHDPRVVVLGDSFIEGWGVDAPQRMSDRLEAATGVPHLNFGMAHFSPYQSLLVYRHLAKEFDHSVVMIGILPENDFVDLDLESARNFPDYEYRYRPYLLEAASGYEHFDHRENALHRWLRRNSYAYQAVKAAAPRLGFAAAPPDPAARKGSRFYDFGEGDVRRLEFILDELRSEAGNRELVVLLLPVARDLRRYERDGADPLSQRLGAWAARSKVTLVNLLPPLAKAASASEAIAFACDYHWNAKAHAAAARVVRRRLAGRFYSPLAAGSQGRSAR